MRAVRKITQATLLASTSMTVMAGAIIAPALPGIGDAFARVPEVATLAPLVLTITSLAIALCSIPAGLLCDKTGCKRVLLVSLLLYALAGTVGLYTESLYQLLASRFALGVAVSGVMTSANTLIADLFEGTQRLTFLSLQSASMALGAVAFLLAGGLLAQASWRYPFALYALSLLVFVATYLFIREPKPAPESPPHSSEGTCPEIPRAKVALLYLTAFSGMLLFYLIASRLPFLLKTQFEATPPLVGAVIATSNLFGAVSGFNYKRVRHRLSAHQSFALSFSLIAAGFIIVAHASSLPIFFLAMATCGLGTGLIGPNVNASLADLVPIGQRGRFFGGLTTSIFIGQFLSPLSIQYSVTHHGYQGTLGAFSLAATAALLVSAFYFIYQKLSRGKRHPPPIRT